MYNYDRDPGRDRGTFLGVFLTLLVAVGFLFFLIAISGFFLWAAVIVTGIGLVTCLHYLLWGWALSESAAAEREEEERHRQVEADEWDLPPPRHSEHFRRF
jgi:hypothetical protein